MRHRKKSPFKPEVSLGIEFQRMIQDIRDLDRKIGEFVLSESDYLKLVKEAYSSNIHWSTKIEGSPLTLDQVRNLTTEFTNGKVRESRNGPTQEILNHLSFMFIGDNLAFPWTISTVCTVHGMLMRGVGQATPGAIRTRPVSVCSADGTEYFIACPPSSVAEELDTLLQWLRSSPYDPVVSTAIFFHEFESIHPFEDGNGRTGRTLFHLLLQAYGLKHSSLCMIEEELVSDTETYYTLLAYTDAMGDYTHLVEFVIESLLRAYQRAYRTFESKDRLRDFNHDVRSFAVQAKAMRDFTVADMIEWSKLGEKTVRSRLDILVESGIIGKSGKTRAMRYVFLDPFRKLRAEVGGDLDRIINELELDEK